MQFLDSSYSWQRPFCFYANKVVQMSFIDGNTIFLEEDIPRNVLVPVSYGWICFGQEPNTRDVAVCKNQIEQLEQNPRVL